LFLIDFIELSEKVFEIAPGGGRCVPGENFFSNKKSKIPHQNSLETDKTFLTTETNRNKTIFIFTL
jgi:hypothetical protein